MASARRRAGLLRETILRVMEEGTPMRPVLILERVHREGLAVPASLFFRDLGKLVARGAVVRVHVARSYMLAPAEQRILVFCQSCGQVAMIAADSVFARIAAVAKQRNFRVSRSVVEAVGVCTACRSHTAQ